MAYKPTSQQQTAVDLFKTRKSLKIAAFAGAGKTSTLKFLAGSRPDPGIYLAFNRSIADEAKEKFPTSVLCCTTHSLAWKAVGGRFSNGQMSGKVYPKQLSSELGLPEVVLEESVKVTGVQQAFMFLSTIRSFCQSSDPEITLRHVAPPFGKLMGLSKGTVEEFQKWVLEQATTLWTRMTNHRDQMPLGHDGYLKLWALGQPNIGKDYILLDEAQDTNEVVLGVLHHQDSQIVYVGDRHQQIYEWRGAVNAMEKIDDCNEAYLTMSFRFGDGIAREASKVLKTLGEVLPVEGNPDIASLVDAQTVGGDVVLARTNAVVLLEVLRTIESGGRPHVVGGVDEMKKLLSDVFDLKKGLPGSCPEFFGFDRWEDVVEFSKSEEGADLRTFVQIVETHGEEKLWAAVKNVEPKEERATIVISTAHKGKGREWDRVRIASDFLSSSPSDERPIDDAEARLFYVAMTRAKTRLSVETEMLRAYQTRVWKGRDSQSFEVKSGNPRTVIPSPSTPSATVTQKAAPKDPPRKRASLPSDPPQGQPQPVSSSQPTVEREPVRIDKRPVKKVALPPRPTPKKPWWKIWE